MDEISATKVRDVHSAKVPSNLRLRSLSFFFLSFFGGRLSQLAREGAPTNLFSQVQGRFDQTLQDCKSAHAATGEDKNTAL